MRRDTLLRHKETGEVHTLQDWRMIYISEGKGPDSREVSKKNLHLMLDDHIVDETEVVEER